MNKYYAQFSREKDESKKEPYHSVEFNSLIENMQQLIYSWTIDVKEYFNQKNSQGYLELSFLTPMALFEKEKFAELASSYISPLTFKNEKPKGLDDAFELKKQKNEVEDVSGHDSPISANDFDINDISTIPIWNSGFMAKTKNGGSNP